MTNRISQRLYSMAQDAKAEREAKKREAVRLQIENASTASSTAMVVCEIAEQKRKEVNSFFDNAYKNSLRKGTGFSYGRNSTAHSAGAAAGNRVNLGRAIGEAAQRRIA